MTKNQTCEEKKDLDYWLGEITVWLPGELEPPHPQELFAVDTWDGGVVAYFINKSDAFRFRLAEINRRLNG